MGTGFTLKAVALAAAALLAVAAPAAAGGAEPGEKAPELLVKDWVNGGPVDVRTCENEVVVVWFFHSVAPDMEKYTKYYVDLLEQYGKKGLRIVGVSREQQAALVNFADETKVTFPLATDDGSWKGNYGIDAYPWTYIV